MSHEKKHDIRDGKHLSATNTDSKMAGGEDRKATVAPKTGEHVLTPGPSSHTPDGQTTKSS